MRGFHNIAMTKIAFILMMLVCFTACKKDKDDRLKENILEIEQYIIDNDLNDLGIVQKTESGLHYIVQKEGDGMFPTSESVVKVRYRGFLTDNSIFDQNPNFETPLSNVIEGWKEGIPKFSRGGSGLLLIPSKLGYGSRGAGSTIPGYAVLIFEIELLDF